MNHSVKIRALHAPPSELSSFDPAEFLASLEFYETSEPISEAERDELAQFAHFLAFLALQAKSFAWSSSTIPLSSTAYAALAAHFGGLPGWESLHNDVGLPYRALSSFLMGHYPPHGRA